MLVFMQVIQMFKRMADKMVLLYNYFDILFNKIDEQMILLSIDESVLL